MATVPISDGDPKNSYTATAGQTVFPYTFWIKEEGHLAVYVNGALKTLSTDYTVSAIESPTGGNVVFGSGLSEDDAVVLVYDPQFERTSEFTGTIRLDALNTELTYLLTLAQSNQRKIDDALRTSDTETTTFSGELPTLTGNGGKVLRLAADASSIEYVTIGDSSAVGNFESVVTDGDNLTTTFALGFTPASAQSLLVEVGGQLLEPAVDYTFSGTDITFTTAPATGTDNIVIRNLASGVAATVPADLSVTTAKLVDDSVTTAKIVDSSITTGKLADDSVTLAKMEHATQGDLIYYGSSGAPARLSPGTAGQVLQSGGAGGNPSWVDASSGGLVLISSQTASGDSSVDFTSGITSTYDMYIIIGTSVVPSDDSVTLRVRTSTDGGSSFDAAANDYEYVRDDILANTGISSITASQTNAFLDITSTTGTGTGEHLSFTMKLFDPSNASLYTCIESVATYANANSGTLQRSEFSGLRQAAADVDALRFYFSSGNITSGTFSLYGVKKS